MLIDRGSLLRSVKRAGDSLGCCNDLKNWVQLRPPLDVRCMLVTVNEDLRICCIPPGHGHDISSETDFERRR